MVIVHLVIQIYTLLHISDTSPDILCDRIVWVDKWQLDISVFLSLIAEISSGHISDGVNVKGKGVLQ